MASEASPDYDAVLAGRATQIAEQVRSARAAMNISRKEFEKRYHVGRNTLAKVESDEGHLAMSTSTQHRLEDAFGWERGQIDRWIRRGLPPGPPTAPVVIDTNALLELAHVMGLAKKFAELPERFASVLENLVDEILLDRAG